MADLLLRLNSSDDVSAKQNEVVERIGTSLHGGCWIHGKPGTYSCYRVGEDAIAAVGYVCHVGVDSMESSLRQILSSFDESQIGDLKKQLVGQYILLVKEGSRVYIFSDFIGARNVFYSDDGVVVSSSLSRIEDLLQTGPA